MRGKPFHIELLNVKQRNPSKADDKTCNYKDIPKVGFPHWDIQQQNP